MTGLYMAKPAARRGSLLVAATLAALAMARPAQAKIIYTPASAVIENGQYNLNLNNDGTTDFTIFESNSTSTNSCGVNYVGTLNVQAAGGGNVVEVYSVSSQAYADALVAGSRIGPGSGLSSSNALMESSVYGWILYAGCHRIFPKSGSWLPDNGGHYLGLAFLINGRTHYGWAHLSVSEPRKGWLSATLTGFAYETIAGRSILAGAK